MVVTVTKSDAGAYAGKLESVDQGATIPIDAITVNGDAVRLEIKSPAIVIEGALNKERTELTGKFTQGDQQFPVILKRGEPAAVMPPRSSLTRFCDNTERSASVCSGREEVKRRYTGAPGKRASAPLR